MQIGFIGAGNMSTAIIKGLIDSRFTSPEQVTLTKSTAERSKAQADQLGVAFSSNNTELVQQADIIILGVKPQKLPDVLNEIASEIKDSKKIVVSIAAGFNITKIQSFLGDEAKIVRVMPNMNIAIRRSVSGLSFSDNFSVEEKQLVSELFEQLGVTYELAEKDFVTFTAIAGCSPAFTAMYIDGLTRAAVKNGLPYELAQAITLEAVSGTLELMKDKTLSSWDLINQVSSPGGTTIEGVASLENDGFIPSLFHAVDATIKKDQEMSKE
ncbi:pyrroline-5-carboxylate reductase [Vagococcus elongatus]|uniref:Pyrroline-5-carboxylate reductase n=1 Tax=Vagococcus elongatus TaxID=180344 RepID=A0A430AZM9_9ENTE|nr:pyrroline-5-carboxylate reductase [Vagococcus elongatus]RSU13547.1 pyrroline-5-carboxylate reductase [Vagococcus elongatus]